MNELDLKICQEVVTIIQSAKYSAKNYLFLEPVDQSIFTTYATVVARPMDLGTVSKNLERGVYKTREECFQDCDICFDNAETFHKDFPENKWIIKLGKDMKKILAKERARVEKKLLKATATTTATPAAKAATSEVKNAASNPISSGTSTKQPKIRLSLVGGKTNTGATTLSQPSIESSSNNLAPPAEVLDAVKSSKKTTTSSKKTKAKLSLKLNANKTSATSATASSSKLKLKISSNSMSSIANNTDDPSFMTTTPKATSEQQFAKQEPTTAAPTAKKGTHASSSSKKKEKLNHRILPTASKVRTYKSTLELAMSTPVPATASTMTVDNTLASDGGIMTDFRKDQCYKSISALKRSDYENVSWFTHPVNDPRLIDDYKAKIQHPMDLGTMWSKLDRNEYQSVSEFALDMRRVFGNCLVFNNTAHDSFRPVAVKMISLSEDIMHLFIQCPQNTNGGGRLYQTILYCWKECLEIIESALELKNPDDGFPTIHYFLFPVFFYYGGLLPQDYAEKVRTPMDFGTITSRIVEGFYQKVEDFVSDCKLVTSNCMLFYKDRTDGSIFVGQAQRLEDFLSSKLDLLLKYDASPQGDYARKISCNPVSIKLKTVPQSLLLNALEALRNLNYVDKATKFVEPAAAAFEMPVNTTFFPDYLDFVKRPMDLSTVEKNIKDGKYKYPEDFENDVLLIFRNCEAYNVPKKNIHILNVARACTKFFKKTYAHRMRSFLSSNEVSKENEKIETKRQLSQSTISGPPPKKMKSDDVTVPPKVSIPLAKPKPRIILALGPLPLHVAIAKVKQDYENRRMHKDLTGWEGACSKFYRDLKRHPWISSSKRFVFDAPVILLHPEIKAAYLSKIKKPMDLTTAECRLLHGGYYSCPQDFVDDIALVFMNAVTFNEAGHQEGDPTSCAYYDASRHLLRYSRWLSLDTLSDYLFDDTGMEGAQVKGPVPQWKLSISNHKDALEEMEEIVMNHFIDKSDEGENFTWIESECEKLLRSLRTQSDSKYMRFFIEPIYPENYFLYISKPISCVDCDKKLQDREYDTFGDLVTDLRLIFENAKKYNGKMKDTDPISRLAYDSATIMAEKLEVAIQRLFVIASDRLEREKVENDVLDREERLAEKQEEERLVKEWQQQREAGPEQSDRSKLQSELIQITRRPNKKKIDFDMPFYDEEAPREQFEVDLLQHQKMLYEKQQLSRKKMHEVTRMIGMRVYHNLQEHSKAFAWSSTQSMKLQPISSITESYGDGTSDGSRPIPNASEVASFLEQSDRDRIKVVFRKQLKTKRNACSFRLNL
jgi:hypothetical protein